MTFFSDIGKKVKVISPLKLLKFKQENDEGQKLLYRAPVEAHWSVLLSSKVLFSGESHFSFSPTHFCYKIR